MARFKMENFGGEVPAIDNRIMPEQQGAAAINTWLLSGRIEPVHSLTKIYTPRQPGTRSVFRIPISTPDIDRMANSYWLEFQNQNVRVIRSPVTGQDDDGRYYWADGVYPKYVTGGMIKEMNATMRGAWSSTTTYLVNDGVTSGGVTYVAILSSLNQAPPNATYWVVMPTPYKLGSPTPLVAPGVTASGGVSTTNQGRVYTYTWVTSNGEEGPAAPPSTLVTNKTDATWHITMTAPSPTATADRNLTHTRIYRSVTSTQGVASYFFVAEVPIGTLAYDDTQTDAQITLNEQLLSTEWSEPPSDLQGLVSMPNGMVAAWRKNEVWFCEPYEPHAWPLKYMIAVPTNIVGLGVLGQTLIILTEGNPWSATGIMPGQMSLAIIQPLEACTARLSIVNTPNGVLYCSPNGLINITPSGAANLTKDIILKEQWAQVLNLTTVAAGVIAQGYYAYSVAEPGVFQTDTFQVADAFQDISHFGTRPGIFLSLTDPRVALNRLDPGTVMEVMNIITDIFNGELMLLRDGIVYVVDVRQQVPYGQYRWRSKMFTTNYLMNLGAAKVYWTPAYKDALNQSAGDTVFRMYSAADSQEMEDGLTLRFEEKLSQSGQMFRLPSGYKALYWQFEVEGYAIIDAIHAASTARELREI